VYRVVREATLTTARREDFRIVHLSIQRTHIHLLVEANDKRALAAGLQGFQISAAKHLNAAISKGKANNWRNLVAPGGLEALWCDLCSRCTEQAAVMRVAPATGSISGVIGA
jgi:REP element-mobilizing transposase RayT